MFLEFSTKRDINGNRYYLGIDTDKKIYSRERGAWYGRDDIVEISRKDRKKIIETIERENFIEIEHF